MTTLNQITTQVDSIKSDIVNVHSKLKEKVKTLGIDVLDNDKLLDIINKIPSVVDMGETYKEVWKFSNAGIINSVAVDSDGNVYSGCDDRTVKKTSPAGKEVWKFSNAGSINSVAVDSKGNVYSGGYDRTVKKTSPAGKEIWAFTGNASWVNSIAVDSKGNVYSGGYDYTVRKISQEGKEIWKFKEHEASVSSIAVDRDGNVYSCSRNPYYQEFKKINNEGKEVLSLNFSQNIIISIAVDKDSVYIGGSMIKKLNNNNCEEIWRFEGNTDTVYSVTVDNYGNVYSGGRDKTVRKINSEGKEVWKFSNIDTIDSVAVDDYGNVYIGGHDKTVKKIEQMKILGIVKN